jgi:hypothetical protein
MRVKSQRQQPFSEGACGSVSADDGREARDPPGGRLTRSLGHDRSCHSLDRPVDVRLYERFAFTVTAQRTVLGVPNWFMRRSPRRLTDKPAARDG